MEREEDRYVLDRLRDVRAALICVAAAVARRATGGVARELCCCEPPRPLPS